MGEKNGRVRKREVSEQKKLLELLDNAVTTQKSAERECRLANKMY